MPTAEKLIEVAQLALDEWALEEIGERQSLSGGRSGALVVRVNVAKSPKSGIPSGNYILKVCDVPDWEDVDAEDEAHNRALEYNSEFATLHIPDLLAVFEIKYKKTLIKAILLEIAGGTYHALTPTDVPGSGALMLAARKISSELASSWTNDEWSSETTALKIFQRLCGYRLKPEKAKEFHKFYQNHFGDSDTFFVDGELLINPLRFLGLAPKSMWRPFCAMHGLSHNDLHGGNILASSLSSKAPYYVIDLALSQTGHSFFDQAYLEISQLLLNCEGRTNETILHLLKAVAEEDTDAEIPPNDCHYSFNLLKDIRSGLTDWQSANFVGRKMEVMRQSAICRVAAGVNWANKSLPEGMREQAIVYAGSEAARYIRLHEPEVWKAVTQSLSPVPKANWEELWGAAKGFSDREQRIVLIAGRLTDIQDIEAVASLPISAVVDLDTSSTTDGLCSIVEKPMSRVRAVHQFVSEIPPYSLTSGTAWMHAGGNKDFGRQYKDINEWRFDGLPEVRSFAESFAARSSPHDVLIVVLPSAKQSDRDVDARVEMSSEAFELSLKGRGRIVELGRVHSGSVPERTTVDGTPRWFAERIKKTFGVPAPGTPPTIPGKEGQRTEIPLGFLNSLEEPLIVLHSEAPERPRDIETNKVEFWRGRPIQLQEVEAGADVDRDLTPGLSSAISDMLKLRGQRLVELTHFPGSGGTTVATRLAWDLRNTFPTSIIRSAKPSLKERVRDLFHLVDATLLLVADHTALTTSERDDLLRFLEHNHCSCVLLYVRRELSVSGDEDFVLPSIMSDEECQRFRQLYSTLTTSADRRREIARITESGSLKQYRQPFFYGLAAFEEEYSGIESFVVGHLDGLHQNTLLALEMLSIVTLFSGAGLDQKILEHFLEGSPEPDKTTLLAGSHGVARLIVKDGSGVSILHPILAQELLETAARIRGSSHGWELELSGKAKVIISGAVTAVGQETAEPLLRQLFIERGSSQLGERDSFSLLIEKMNTLSTPAAREVLGTLTEFCPNEGHFWNHLSRHYRLMEPRDLDRSVDYMRRACEEAQTDGLHQHGLGMALRTRVYETIKASPAEPSALMDAIRHDFDEAVEAFENSRLLDSGLYGFVSDIELVTDTMRRLAQRLGLENSHMILQLGGELETEFISQLSRVEEVLREAELFRHSNPDTNDELARCASYIDSCYGDFDATIERWNALGTGGLERPSVRRALASAFLARRKRLWSAVPVDELKRIQELAAANLNLPRPRDADVELWLNASFHSADFDLEGAIEKVGNWKETSSRWKPHYFDYALRAVRALSKDRFEREQYTKSLETIRRLGPGDSRSSYWFGGEDVPTLYPSRSVSDWDHKARFFASTKKLKRVDGIIARIDSPQSGYVKANGVDAFFSPGRDFSRNRDELTKVSFFLGFSSVGPRAWKIEKIVEV